MRVLTITSYISSDRRLCFQHNKTGFGYMVHDIISSLSKRVDMDVLVSWYRFKGFKLDGANFLGCSVGQILIHLFQSLSFIWFLRFCFKYRVSFYLFKRLFYCWMLTGYYRSVIKGGKYDVVHIHGCGLNEELWIQVCKGLNVKFVTTLHGLNSFNDSIKAPSSLIRYERDFLKRVVEGEYHITVISTGIKRRILKNTELSDSPFISIVCNSFHFCSCDIISIRSKYSIPVEAKVLLYVGNISENKNQIQMARAYSLLPDKYKNKIWILFCGKMSNDINFMEQTNHNNHIIVCGSVDKNRMPSYYSESDGVFLLSYSEGFGLSLVEGLHFGVPCAMFSDMDAFSDIYDERCSVAIKDRKDDSVAEAIQKIVDCSWNRSIIKDYSKKFDEESMVNKYLHVYGLL